MPQPQNQFPGEQGNTPSYREQLFTDIAAQPGVVPMQLPDPDFKPDPNSIPIQDPHVGFIDSQGESTALAPPLKDDVGREVITQELQAIVKAGDELFAIIDTNTIRLDKTGLWHEAYFVTRFGSPGEPATVVGMVTPGSDPIVVGWTYDPRSGYSTSRELFSVKAILTRLVITDAQSTNHTEVLYKPKNEGESHETDTSQADITMEALKSLAEQRRRNPLVDTSLWSLNTGAVAQVLN